MKPDFETALGDLLSQYADTPREEIITALELQLYAQKEGEANSGEDN